MLGVCRAPANVGGEFRRAAVRAGGPTDKFLAGTPCRKTRTIDFAFRSFFSPPAFPPVTRTGQFCFTSAFNSATSRLTRVAGEVVHSPDRGRGREFDALPTLVPLGNASGRAHAAARIRSAPTWQTWGGSSRPGLASGRSDAPGRGAGSGRPARSASVG